jgi:hypothetical protein
MIQILLGGEEQPQDIHGSERLQTKGGHYQPLDGEWKALWSWKGPHRSNFHLDGRPSQDL